MNNFIFSEKLKPSLYHYQIFFQISRLGIIFLEPDILGWQTLTKSWINKCNPKWMNECKQFIFDLFEWIIPPVISLSN